MRDIQQQQPLVFWPHAGAFDAGAILELCAQLLWCELYDIRRIYRGDFRFGFVNPFRAGGFSDLG